MVLTATAAADVHSVLIRSTLDEFEAPVAEDGFIVALLRAPWRSNPTATAHMMNGQRVPCVQPGLAEPDTRGQ
ncbi:hypothetical protein [Rhodococcus oxybenzonivorans]|uniref:hypothetical protein n=1 Tax=Rhodococcus oxybenzonivorans TaxID=1990687 RepID=UPI001952864F|nr:hypothetical protein [Rhodococcus oxybenzonivorans]